jgi:hypothetical protein
MWQDPIVEEVRRIRDEHAKRFNYDLHAICEDFRKMQSSSGHTVVSRQPRRSAIPLAQQQGAVADAPASASLQQGRG